LPSASSAYAIANCDPIESPSGRACEVRSQRVVLRRVVRVGDGLGALGLDLLQDLLDAVVPLDAFIEEELQLGRAPQAQSTAQLSAKERRGAFKRPCGLTPRLLVAERRVVHARLLEVGRHADVSDGQEADTGIVHLAGQQLREVFANLFADPSRALGHDDGSRLPASGSGGFGLS
jgi:hypothetical protein